MSCECIPVHYGPQLAPVGPWHWTPKTPTPSGGYLPAHWYKSNEGVWQDAGVTPALIDGDVVGRWEDLAANADHMNQAVVANKPTRQNGVAGGHPAIRFDGLTDYLQGAFATGGALAQPFTIFVMAKLDPLAVDDNITRELIDGDDAVNRMLLRTVSTTIPDCWSLYFGVLLNGTPANSDWNLWSVLANGAATQFWHNGISEAGPGYAGIHRPDGMTVGARWSGGPAAWYGDVAEILIYAGQLDITDFNLVGGYFAWRYSHVYTDAACTGCPGDADNIIATAVTRVNSTSAVCSPITSLGTTELIGYWNSAPEMVLAKRTFGGSWSYYQYPLITGDVTDAHHSINLGIDSDGYLHIAYNHHSELLHYRKSMSPLSTWNGQLTEPLMMLGANEYKVTYTRFFHDPLGVMYFMFRLADSGDGDEYFYQYDTASKAWAAASGTSTSGLLIKASDAVPDENAYLNGSPRFSDDWDGVGTGHMDLFWVWRETMDATTNHDIMYARWDGTYWTTETGAAQVVPITPVNANVVQVVAQNTGLSNQTTSDVDGNGRPHTAYLREDGAGDTHIYHLWYNGAIWVEIAVTGVMDIFTSDNTGRPEIAIDRATNTVYMFYRDDLDVAGAYMVQVSDPDDFTVWTKSTAYDSQNVGLAEPHYDRPRFNGTGEFHLWVCPTSNVVPTVPQWIP